jgi:hypothetical protein
VDVVERKEMGTGDVQTGSKSGACGTLAMFTANGQVKGEDEIQEE